MLQIWLGILKGLPPASVTPQTVTALHLRAPLLSCSDERSIASALRKTRKDTVGKTQYQIFPGIVEASQRDAVMERLRTCNRILSFHSFFEDMVYLDEVSSCEPESILQELRVSFP